MPMLNAQDVKGVVLEKDSLKKSSELVKTIFYKLPDSGIRTPYGNAKVKIVSIESDGVKLFAFVIGFGGNSATLMLVDLLKSIEALQKLKKESIIDLALNPDYLENKFTSNDFNILYKVEQSKLTWYLLIDGGMIKIKDVTLIERNLILAIEKMNQLLIPTK